ncbi:MAG: DUF29 domain-containing protein [Pseudanabaena sp.]|jgi:hypothetical protein
MTQTIAPPSTLYERDLNLWLGDAIAKLNAGDFQNLDVENLIEELEGLAGRDRREVSNRLKRLIEHILKRCYVDMPECYRGWEVTIINQRDELDEILSQSPSLKQAFLQCFDDAFKKALRLVKTEYREVSFPDNTWQFGRDIDTMLNVDFWE